jgi:hypothetical protein
MGKTDKAKETLIEYVMGFIYLEKIGWTEHPEDQIHPEDKLRDMINDLCNEVRLEVMSDVIKHFK